MITETRCQCLDHSGLNTRVGMNEKNIEKLDTRVSLLDSRLDTHDAYVARTVAKASGYIAGAAMVVGILFRILGKYL